MKISAMTAPKASQATPREVAGRYAPQFAGLGAKTSTVDNSLRLSFQHPFDTVAASATLRDRVDGVKLQFWADAPIEIGGTSGPGFGVGGGSTIIPRKAQEFLVKLPDTAVGFGPGGGMAVRAQSHDAFAAAKALVRPEINGKPSSIEFIGIGKPQRLQAAPEARSS